MVHAGRRDSPKVPRGAGLSSFKRQKANEVKGLGRGQEAFAYRSMP